MKLLPILLLLAAAVAGFYLLYYKPQQEKTAADNAAALAASQTELLTVKTPTIVASGLTAATKAVRASTVLKSI